jgi:hypothetical protein
MLNLTSIEADLPIGERADMVRIAHETHDPDVKKWALDTLERASPPMLLQSVSAPTAPRPAPVPHPDIGIVPACTVCLGPIFAASVCIRPNCTHKPHSMELRSIAADSRQSCECGAPRGMVCTKMDCKSPFVEN